MRISKVRVEGYRCVEDVTIAFDDLTVLVGAGGVGKSAFLRAMEWFFDDTPLDGEDMHLPQGDERHHADQLTVTVSFDSLNAAGREVLGRYGGDKITTFTRTGRPGENSKLSGTALVCRDFDDIRAESDGRKRRALFTRLVETRGDEFGFTKPAPSRVADADLIMERFERANPTRCELEEADASHLFGWVVDPSFGIASITSSWEQPLRPLTRWERVVTRLCLVCSRASEILMRTLSARWTSFRLKLRRRWGR
jgi:putative ATP-dependent endonuclease of the OLD family